jgi:hypothetical protein
MPSDDVAKQLHDRATRGEVLSGEERPLLEAWYAQQDQQESATLAQASPAQTLAALQAQVDSAVAQLVLVTERIQKLTADNEVLRGEVVALQRQLPRKPVPPST